MMQHSINENFNPMNVYAITKFAHKNISKFIISKNKNIKFYNFKLYETFGLNDKRNKLIPSIIKNYKKEFLPYNYRGIIFLSLNRYSDALIDFNKAIALNPNFAQGYNNIALAYRSLNLRERALSAYKKSLNLSPESVEARINIGILYTELYLYLEAIESFNYVLKKISDHEHAHQLIADVYLKIFNYGQALHHHICANKINPSNHLNYFLIGTYYVSTGEREKSSQYFRQSLGINPTYCQAYYGLSRVENLKLDDPLFTQAMNLLKSENIPDDEKVFLHFFAAKIYENNSNSELFFKHLNQGCVIQLIREKANVA
jgi:tetratricopeptide (TPR) repeat protein